MIDDLEFNEDGRYLIKNQWQTLGTGDLDGPRYRCRQQDATMIIDSLDDSVLQLRDRYGHFLKYYKGSFKYPYAEAETVLSQIVPESPRRAGDSLSFVNVIATGVDVPEIESHRVNRRLCQVTASDQDWWFVTGAVDGPVLRTDAKVSVLGPDRITLAGATTVRIAGSAFEFEEPVVWHLDTKKGSWAAFPVRRDLTRYDDAGTPIRPGPVQEGTLAWSPAQTARVVGAVRADEAPWRPAGRGLPAVSELPDGWRQLGEVAGPVTGVGRSDEGLLIGTATGGLTAVDGDGAVLWSQQLSGRINEITQHENGDDRLIAVATEAWRVHALGVDGTRRWERRFSNDIVHREQKGNLLGITAVRTGYVHGRDQAPLLMVGTQFRWVYGLSWTGAVQHEMMLTFYGIEDAVFADLDGDGIDEGAFALEYFYPSVWDDNADVHGDSAGGAGFTTVGLHTPEGESPMIIYGTKQNVVRSYRYTDGKIVPGWVRNVGGQVTTLSCGAFHPGVGDEIVLGTTGFHAVSLRPDGAPRFRASIGDRVEQLLPAPERGYLVSADHGLLVELDPLGKERGRWRFPAPVAGVALMGDRPTAVLGDGRVVGRAE